MNRNPAKECPATAQELIQFDYPELRDSPRDLFDQLLQEKPVQHICEPALPCNHHHHHHHHQHKHQHQHKHHQHQRHNYKYEHRHSPPRDQDRMVPQQQQDHPGCKCTKVGCLKLYCQCFAKGRKCNSKCVCIGCQNHPGNQAVIYHAQQVANHRNPDYFKGIPAFVPVRRCTCKKSSCRKNYCQCFRAGVKCGAACECVGCLNGRCDSHDNNNQYSGPFILGFGQLQNYISTQA